MTVRDRMRLALLAAALLPCLARAQATNPPADAAAQPAAPAAEPAPAPAPPPKPAKPPVTSSFATTFYGFVEFDISYDTTQSYQEGIGSNPSTARPETAQSKHGRTIFTGRNSRFGFRIAAPEYNGIKVTGVIEADFEGNQPSSPPASTEFSYYVPGTLRLRQGNIKIENKFVDVLVGQTWALYGWQPFFFPATVFNLGGPWAEPFNRSAQLRLSKNIKTDAFVFDVAAAAARPPQRDAEAPDFQGGLRLGFAGWKGLHTPGFGGTTADPVTIGISGAYRSFRVSSSPASTAAGGLVYQDLKGSGYSIDAIIPVVPVQNSDDRRNALTINASYTNGDGTSDLLGNITGGLPKPATLNANTPIDAGFVGADASGKFHTINWNGYLIGAQYYLPPSGKIFVSANYAFGQSDNIKKYAPAPAAGALTGVWKKNLYYDANVFWDITPALRTGFSYEHLEQTYVDDVKAKNDRFQTTTCLFF